MKFDKKFIREKITSYIDSYNNSDLSEMEKFLDDDIIYKNIVDDDVNITTKGKNAFLELNKKSFSLFTEKEKEIITIFIEKKKIIAEIFFHGVLAKDLNKDVLKGDKVRIETNTEFTFSDKSGLIIEITDYSS